MYLKAVKSYHLIHLNLKTNREHVCTTSAVTVKHSLIYTMKLHNFTSGIPLSVLIINFTRQFRYPFHAHIPHISHFQSIKPNLNVTHTAFLYIHMPKWSPTNRKFTPIFHFTIYIHFVHIVVKLHTLQNPTSHIWYYHSYSMKYDKFPFVILQM